MNKECVELYVLMLDGKILTPGSFSEYFKSKTEGKNYHGWNLPKKIYYSLAMARNGLRYLPVELRSKIEIHRFESVEKMVFEPVINKRWGEK